MAGLGVVSLSVRGALVAERLRVFMYGDGFASIDGELIAARPGEQRTGSVPAAHRQRQPPCMKFRFFGRKSFLSRMNHREATMATLAKSWRRE